MSLSKFTQSFLFGILFSVYTADAFAQPGTNIRDSDNVNSDKRIITKVSDGIYMIRHEDAPDAFPQGNTTVIIGEKSVLVVDACYLPSSAKKDIDQIREWTNKPVSWLLNTHWHYDHTMGNGTYAKEFPDIHIVSQTETKNQIEGYTPGWFRRYPDRDKAFDKYLQSGKNDDGTPLSESDIKDIHNAIKGIKPVEEEFKKITDRIPDVTFETEMSIDLGNRIVKLMHPGRGNTAGDAVAYLPAEKILIAGDLVDHPVPYLGGGFPSELITTLKKLNDLDIKNIIPGHGNLLEGKAFLQLETEFITLVVSEVSKEVHLRGNDSKNLDVVRESVSKTIDIVSWRNKFTGDNIANREFFDGFSYPGLVKASFAETWRR